VSDDVLAGVDALVFVDSSPEALRKRLSHGNIYPADQVGHALDSEFQPVRLAALREIALRLVALQAAGQDALPPARPRELREVLVAVTQPEQADSLVRRGIRLARRLGGAPCRVLAVSQRSVGQYGPPPAALVGAVEAAATVAGVPVLVRETRDAGAAIASAVQEINARHLVLAVPPGALLERWRATQLERLAGQLAAAHLHVEIPAGPHADGTDRGAAVSGPVRAPQRRGVTRVYLGYAPGCGTTSAMLAEALRRKARGADVVIGAIDARGREHVVADLEQLEMVGDGTTLDTAAVLARKPEVVCVDDLTAGTTTAERRFVAARRLAAAGITVIGTVRVGNLGAGAGAGAGNEAGDALLDQATLLALADEMELVDVPPPVLIDRVRRAEIVPADRVDQELASTFAPDRLRAERERAFRIVAEHAERRLAAYAGEPFVAPPGPDERQPCILACASPRPGMEALIRRAAALAAQVDGEFRVATVRLREPLSAEDQLLVWYAELTEQLGGEYTVLSGLPAASALAEFASEHRVTELVLGRTGPGQAGRYPVLRELARLARDCELHVLPAE
jgi:two-component system sensor histidine kinase KdpD